MKAAQRASILAEMDTVFAAKITKVMHPDEP
jgi:flagellar motility protein MotE (MotC chaperone)